MPGDGLEAGQEFGDRGRFRIEGGALGRCGRKHRELAGLHLRQQQRHVVEGQIDLATEQILGVACLDLGYTVLSHGSLRPIVEPLLRDLVPDVGDAASLGILDGGDVVYLARIGAGLDRHKMDRRPGTRIPAYSAALGHAMLAHLARDEQIERLEARPRVKLSERTLTDLDALLARLDQVKKKGHAVSDGENAYGLRTLATPIFDARGLVIGGLSVTVDAMRMDMQTFRDQALPRLMQATREVQDLAIKSGLTS